MDIGSTIYLIFVLGIVGLLAVSLSLFVRTILRKSSQKTSSLKLQKEQNELLRELIQVVKERQK